METKNIIITDWYKFFSHKETKQKYNLAIEFYDDKWAYFSNGSIEELNANKERWSKSYKYYSIYDVPSSFLNSNVIKNLTGLPEWD